MANTLKIKIGIGTVSLMVLIVIAILQTNFFSTVIIKRWGKVSWDDFQGIPQPFSTYEAGISSAIYLEYDSVKKRYVAYAGQNNIQSWAKRSRNEQDYTLNHEQYHFNITELHARKLNDYIAENPDRSLRLYLLRLGSIQIDHRHMQRDYDLETDHSLIFDKQRHWEYQIDSLLSLEKGWLTDHFSGAQVYLPHPVDSTKGLANGVPYRVYTKFTYGMQFSLISFQVSDLNYSQTAANVKMKMQENSERLRAFLIDTINTFRMFTISEDTSKVTYYQLWTANDSYLYKVRAEYPNATGDTTGYSKIASSFLNSFRVVNTDNYWIAKSAAVGSPIVHSTISKIEENINHSNTKSCIHIGPPGNFGFYRGPFYRDDNAMFVAYDNLVHEDSLHHKDVMIVNKDLYSFTPTHEGQIFIVPGDKVPKEKYNIKFGYTLLEDSLSKCYELYHQSIDVHRKPEEIIPGL